MKLKILFTLPIFTFPLYKINATQLDKQLGYHFTGTSLHHAHIHEQNKFMINNTDNTENKIINSNLKWPFFDTITIKETQIIAPKEFKLKYEDQLEIEKNCFSKESISESISYYLENEINDAIKENKKLASLYVISSIWAGNKGIDFLNDLYDYDSSLVNDIRKSDRSQKSVEDLIKRIKWGND